MATQGGNVLAQSNAEHFRGVKENSNSRLKFSLKAARGGDFSQAGPGPYGREVVDQLGRFPPEPGDIPDGGRCQWMTDGNHGSIRVTASFIRGGGWAGNSLTPSFERKMLGEVGAGDHRFRRGWECSLPSLSGGARACPFDSRSDERRS